MINRHSGGKGGCGFFRIGAENNMLSGSKLAILLVFVLLVAAICVALIIISLRLEKKPLDANRLLTPERKEDPDEDDEL